ncbi:hypothetical protein MKEN_00923900 [Mycena kentingensis (nom. inval.)]|nr:hypothetical protein MKEN_00923900 [Mycena kentingensis (nom. inval.)]
MPPSKSTEIRVAFDDIQPASEPFVAQFWSVPGIPDRFAGFPNNTNTLRIPQNSLFSNYGAREAARKVMPLKTAREWGINYPEDRVFYAKAQAEDGSCYCLRFIFNADRVAVDPHHPKHENCVNMVQDARFYVEHGKIGASLFIPMHFGLWLMETDDFAGVVIVSVTQWCGTPFKTIMNTEYDTLANRILVGRTLEIMHDAGLELNGYMGDYKHLTNILIDLDDPCLSKDDKMNGRARCYIADLSGARTHTCERQLPILPFASHLSSTAFGCREIGNAAFLLGFLPSKGWDAEPYVRDVVATKAVNWYNAYYDNHESYANWAVLAAQRTKLFPNLPPVYRGLRITFEDDADELQADLGVSEFISSQSVSPIEPLTSCTRRELASKVFRYDFRREPRQLKPTASTGSTSSSSSSSNA